MLCWVGDGRVKGNGDDGVVNGVPVACQRNRDAQ